MSSSLLMTWQRVLQQKGKCKSVDKVSNLYDSYDLTIRIKRTGIVYHLAPETSFKEPTITVKGQRLQVVHKFIYLESTLSEVVHIDDEVNAMIAKSSAAFGRLRGSIRDQSGIGLDTKLKFYRSVVLLTLSYTCETWTVYKRHDKRLNHFYTSCLRELLKIKLQNRIPDTEFLKRAVMQSIHTFLKLVQLRWTGRYGHCQLWQTNPLSLSLSLSLPVRVHARARRACVCVCVYVCVCDQMYCAREIAVWIRKAELVK